ncbi:MAG TPA: hypothetical protein VIL83_09360 [Capillibacterium sp.]
MNRKKFGYGLLLVFILYVCFPFSVAGAPPGAKLILVNLTRVAFPDFDTGDYPYLQRLLTEGQIGLVSVRVAGKLTPEKVYQKVGMSASDPLNEGFFPEPGLIGTALRQVGKRTAFFGNADLPWKTNRTAKLMISDDRGQVDREVADRRVLTADPEFPFGFRTDYHKLEEFVLASLPQTDLILVETGDLERLEGYRGLMPEERWGVLRAQSLARIDAFLGRLRAVAPPGTIIAVFSATPSSADTGNELPFLSLLLDRKNEPPGLLTFPSTREPGLLTIGDLAALWFRLVNDTGTETGSPRVTAGSWPELAAKSCYWWINLRQREIVLRVYLYFLILLLLLALFLPFTPWRRWLFLIRTLLPALAFLPLTLLLIAAFKITSWPLLVMALVLLTGALWAFACRLFSNRVRAYRALLISTALAILVDLVSGSNLMRLSLLGPSPVLGLRFYGLGNEYLGIFLATFLMGSSAFLTHGAARQWNGALLGVITFLLFSSAGGANFGGGMALAYAAWLVGRCQQKATIRRNLLLFFSTLAGGFSLQTFWPGAGGTTHLHNALRLFKAGAWQQILTIALRKLRMNLELINYSPWGYVLLFCFILFLLGFWLAEKTAWFQRRKTRWPWWGALITVRTGVMAFFANDSGIVVLAPLVLYPLILLAAEGPAGEKIDFFARVKQGEKRGVGNGKD